MYLDQLMNAGHAMDWGKPDGTRLRRAAASPHVRFPIAGVCGMGIMPYDLAMRDALVSQDFLYTLVLKQPDGQHKPSVIGAM